MARHIAREQTQRRLRFDYHLTVDKPVVIWVQQHPNDPGHIEVLMRYEERVLQRSAIC
ncbi:Uncharacterised protein [Legionella pneumophila]|nr:Uncharacterised protein [Legionella pneumophila]